MPLGIALIEAVIEPVFHALIEEQRTMTPLRKLMMEELCRHNYAPRTRETYPAQIAKLAPCPTHSRGIPIGSPGYLFDFPADSGTRPANSGTGGHLPV